MCPHECGKAIISCGCLSPLARGLLDSPSPSFVPPRVACEQQEKQFARAFALVRDAIGQRAFPGAALAVTHRGALIALAGFGRFTYDDHSPVVRPDTVFDLASITKVVATTAMAMLLYEQGKLVLDEPLAATLPKFVSSGPTEQQADRETVTLRMLLAHSSGLPAYEKLFQVADTREALLRAALATRLSAPPGTRAEYSDIGFILLGEVLEQKATVSLDSFAQSKIFAPTGMTHSGFNPPAEHKSAIPPTEDDQTFRHRVIQGEVNDENAWVMGGVAGHAGVFAPAGDLARFAECMLQGGAPIFQPETVALFTRREASPADTTRALGWDTPSRPESSSGHCFSPQAFGHLGFTGTSLWIDPARRLSVSFLSNRTWPDRSCQLIRQVRPQVHDAIVEALEEN